MKYNYDIHSPEVLVNKIVEATKEGKEYVPNSLVQFGKRYVFEMEDGKEIKDVRSVSVIEGSKEGREEEDKVLEEAIEAIPEPEEGNVAPPKPKRKPRKKAPLKVDTGSVGTSS